MSTILSSLGDLGFGDSNSRIIALHDQVDAVSVSSIVSRIHSINEEDEQTEKELAIKYDIYNHPRKPIYLDISTAGGVIYDGLVLVSVIEQSKTPIITRIQGYSFSMGLTIFLAGHERHISRHADIMYHQLSSVTQGCLQDIEDDVKISKGLQKRLEDYVIERTNLTQERLQKIYRQKKDMYFSAKEALEAGIATKII